MAVTVNLDGQRVDVSEGTTVLGAAIRAGIYVPTLCWHPDLASAGWVEGTDRVFQGARECAGKKGDSFMGCDLCVVEVEGKEDLLHSCFHKVEPGQVIRTNSGRIAEKRRAAFAKILAGHPRVCLTCREKEGCPLETCTLNVPVQERCCALLGRCVIEKLHEHFEFSGDLPPYAPDAGRKVATALYNYDFNLCVGCVRCVRVCAGLREVGALGYVMEGGRARVGFTSETPREGVCRYCGACAEICPTGAILDKEPHWTDRERHLVPCRSGCPAGLDVPNYVRAVSQDRPDLAARIIREDAPFGRSLGRVCHAPCQESCHRTALTDAVSICLLKRYACDMAEKETAAPAPATGKRVAVVGSGPAGLSAAWALARKGHAVTVFEEQSEPGGMLRWGIPAFRLPAVVVEDEIDGIRKLGVEIRTSTRVTDVAALRDEFDALLLATGLPRSPALDVSGIDWDGLELLRAARSGNRPGMKGVVLVIGGGNVAVDCALTARVLGAEAVRLVCLEPDGEMPAFAWGLQKARDKGVEIRNRWGPVSVAERNGRKECTFRRCVAVFEDDGRFAPRFDDDERMTLGADIVVAAVGQKADDELPVRADAARGIFAAGDAAGAPNSVVSAVASGKAAASEIDRFLGGDGELSRAEVEVEAPAAIGVIEGFASMKAVEFPAEKPEGPEGEERGLTREEAVREAVRCLQCDLRLAFSQPQMPPVKEKMPARVKDRSEVS